MGSSSLSCRVAHPHVGSLIYGRMSFAAPSASSITSVMVRSVSLPTTRSRYKRAVVVGVSDEGRVNPKRLCRRQVGAAKVVFGLPHKPHAVVVGVGQYEEHGTGCRRKARDAMSVVSGSVLVDLLDVNTPEDGGPAVPNSESPTPSSSHSQAVIVAEAQCSRRGLAATSAVILTAWLTSTAFTQRHGTARFDAYTCAHCPTSQRIWSARFVGNRLA